MTKKYEDISRLPSLDELIKRAEKEQEKNRGVSRRAEKLPLPELLRQLSEYVSAEDLKRLMERPEPSYVPESEPIEERTTTCPILERYNSKMSIYSSAEIKIIGNRSSGSCQIVCEHYNRGCGIIPAAWNNKPCPFESNKPF